MKFGHPDALFWFFLLPILFGISLLVSWRKKRAWSRLAEAGLREKIVTAYAPGRNRIKGVLLFLSLVFLLLALMEPQWGMREEEVRMKGVDLVVLVDVSNSMLAQDVKPSRLERAKRKLKDLFDMLSGDRVGLVAFAGRSFLLSPLTLDYGTLHLFLDEINTRTIPMQGTDLAGAIGLALKTLSDPQSTKAILVITDGEDHSERMQKMVESLKEKKIPLYVLGVGTPEGAPVPDEEGGFKKAEAGDPVVSRLKESFLKDLALSTGGAYVRAVTGDEDLRGLYIRGIRGELEGGELKVSKKRVWETRYYWPLSLALFFLVLERLIPEGRRKKTTMRISPKKISETALSLSFILLWVAPLHAGPTGWWHEISGRRAYQGSDFAKAKEHFQETLASGSNPEDYFNLGAAQYKVQDYAGAEQSFLAALTTTENPLKEKAYYNLGNTLYRLNRLQESVAAYESALKVDPNDPETKLNLEYVKRQLQKQQQPPPQPQPQEQQKEQQQKDQPEQGQGQEQSKADQQQSQGNPQKGEGEQQPQPQSGDSQKDQGSEQNQGQQPQPKDQGQQKQDQQKSQGGQEQQQAGSSQGSPDQKPGEKKEGEQQQAGNQGQQPKPEQGGQPKSEPGDQAQGNRPEDTPGSSAGQQEQESQGQEKGSGKTAQAEQGQDQKEGNQEAKGNLPQQPGEQQAKEGPDGKADGNGDGQQGEQKKPNLEGKLEAAGQAPKGEPTKMAQAKAKESPQEKEANRWLELIEDRSKEIRNRQIEQAIGRTRSVEKDW